jgi:hypothetical protein
MLNPRLLGGDCVRRGYRVLNKCSSLGLRKTASLIFHLVPDIMVRCHQHSLWSSLLCFCYRTFLQCWRRWISLWATSESGWFWSSLFCGAQTRQAERLTYCLLGFLSEDVIMIPNLPQNSIELCFLSQSRTMSVSLATTFLDDCQQLHTDFLNAIPLRTTVILQLPLLAPEMQVARIACRGEPTPYSLTFDPTQDQIGRPFRPQAESSIIVFNVLLEDDIPMQFRRLKTPFVCNSSLCSSGPGGCAPEPSILFFSLEWGNRWRTMKRVGIYDYESDGNDFKS